MHVLYNEYVGECNTALYNHLKENAKIIWKILHAERHLWLQ